MKIAEMQGLSHLKAELLDIFSGGGYLKRLRSIDQAFSNLDDELAFIMEHYIEAYGQNGVSISDLAEGYAFFLSENDKEEKYFFEHGKYRYNSLKEVSERVYENAEYMEKYMLGLAVSMILWPQHRKYFRFFSHFIDECYGYNGKYLEVGAGHGLFVSEALRRGDFEAYDILDISEKSLELTKRMTAGYATSKTVRFIHEDFLKYEGGKYDVISIGEVLEHVENPPNFLLKCRDILTTDGRVYLTTCVNAPEIDHIYMFSGVDEVEDMFKTAGLKIMEKLCITYRDYDIARCIRQRLPINLAYVLV